MDNEFVQISTTTNTKEEAEKIAYTLLEKRLAACVQIIGPITSIYTWKGKTETNEEWICFIKSVNNLFLKIEKLIKQIHTYKTPEIIMVPMILGNKKYLQWIKKATL